MAGEIIGAGIGAATDIIGMITQRAREERALGHQKELMDIQFKNQQALNLQGQQIQLDTWQKTGAPAQMAMLKQAGLNPGLMYSKGGAGGTTGGQGGGSAASGSAPMPQMMNIGNMVDSAKAAAEIALMKAEEKKALAEANKTAGIDTLKTQSEIDKLKADTKNVEQNTILTGIQTDIAEIDKANRQYQIDAEVKNVMEEANGKRIQNQINTEAYDAIVKDLQLRVVTQTVNIEATKAGIELTKQQREAIFTGLIQRWEELAQGERRIEQEGTRIGQAEMQIQQKTYELGQRDKEIAQKDKQIAIDKFKADMDAENPGLMQVAGSIAKKAYDSLEYMMSFGYTESIPHADRVNFNKK